MTVFIPYSMNSSIIMLTMFLPHDNFSIFQYDNNINQLRLIGLVARPGSIMGGEVPRHFQAD